jgi:hypothetical protein
MVVGFLGSTSSYYVNLFVARLHGSVNILFGDNPLINNLLPSILTARLHFSRNSFMLV